MSRILESDNNYSTVEVTWEPPGNNSNSRIGIYHYQLVDYLGGTLHEANTTNTTVTVTISGLLYNIINISFILSANYCGRRSTPVTLILNNVGKYTKF